MVEFPDFSLYHDYTDADAHTYRPVAVTYFAHGNKSMGFINAHHGNDPQNPTHQTIAQAIETYKPQLVIIEGLPSDTDDAHRFSYFMEAKKLAEAKGQVSIPEPLYAAYEAGKKGIAFMGAEPSAQTAFKEMQAQGHSTKDVMALYLANWAVAHKGDRRFDHEATAFLQSEGSLFGTIPQQERLTLGEFRDKYEPLLGHKKLEDISASDLAPSHAASANSFQKMNYDFGRIRDEHLLQTIHDAETSHDRVLVVYGDGHLVQTLPVLQQMFADKGAKIQLVPDDDKAALLARLRIPHSNIMGLGDIIKEFGDGQASHENKSWVTALRTLKTLPVTGISQAR